MNHDLECAVKQLEDAYNKVLLIVETINLKGYKPTPVLENGKLARIDLSGIHN